MNTAALDRFGEAAPLHGQITQLLSETRRDESRLVEKLAALATVSGEGVYQEVLRHLVGKEFAPAQAATYWHEALSRRANRCDAGCAYSGVRSSLLSYLFQVAGEIRDPRIVEADDLENFRHASVTDGLTGLHHQSYFKAHLEQLTERLNDHPGQGLAVVMLDLDHFKQYNDRCGHLAGDVALRQVAEILLSSTRQGDLAARYGGEEFALILHRLNLPQACMVVERIRHAIEAFPFAAQERLDSGCLTISGGIAVHPEDGATALELLQHADERLYRAKQRRNTIFPLGRDQRRARRHQLQSVVEYRIAMAGTVRTGLSRDLSLTGMTLACDQAPALGTPLEVWFRRPFWPADYRTSAVVRNTGPSRDGLLTRVGLQFGETPGPLADLLPG
jgi:diguanylate cyclase (GGDEF)-like protein